MTTRFGRQVELLLGTEGSDGRRYRGIRVGFKVKMSSSGEPNSATIQAWGIGEEAVAAMQEPDAVVRLNAGYDAPRLIFQGSPIEGGVTYERQGAESVLTIDAADGGREYILSNVNIAFATDVTARQILDEVLAQLSLPEGYIETSNATIYPHGLTVTGKARTVLDRLALAEGATWNIRDGAFYFYPKGGATQEPAVVFSSEQGNLIGIPVAKDKNIEFRALLEPSMRPGRACIVRSEKFNGTVIARDVAFAGDSGWANDYYVDVVGQPI